MPLSQLLVGPVLLGAPWLVGVRLCRQHRTFSLGVPSSEEPLTVGFGPALLHGDFFSM